MTARKSALATLARHYVTTALRHDPRAVKLIAQYGRDGIDHEYIDELVDEHGKGADEVITAIVEECRQQYGVTAQYPSETESARRERNGARFNYRMTTELRAKLDEMAKEDQTDVGDFLDMLVEGEWEHRREQRAIVEHKRKQARHRLG